MSTLNLQLKACFHLSSFMNMTLQQTIVSKVLQIFVPDTKERLYIDIHLQRQDVLQH